MKYIAVKPLNDSLKQTRRHFNERPTGVRMLSPICCVSPTLTINTDGVSLNKNSDVSQPKFTGVSLCSRVDEYKAVVKHLRQKYTDHIFMSSGFLFFRFSFPWQPLHRAALSSSCVLC